MTTTATTTATTLTAAQVDACSPTPTAEATRATIQAMTEAVCKALEATGWTVEGHPLKAAECARLGLPVGSREPAVYVFPLAGETSPGMDVWMDVGKGRRKAGSVLNVSALGYSVEVFCRRSAATAA